MDSKGGSETGLQLWKEIKRSLLLMGRIDSAGMFEPVSSTRHGGKNSSWRREAKHRRSAAGIRAAMKQTLLLRYMQNSACVISKPWLGRGLSEFIVLISVAALKLGEENVQLTPLSCTTELVAPKMKSSSGNEKRDGSQARGGSELAVKGAFDVPNAHCLMPGVCFQMPVHSTEAWPSHGATRGALGGRGERKEGSSILPAQS